MKPTEEQIEEYQALIGGGGYVRLADRTWVTITGDDRHSFLHNFCTADINKLEPGQMAEAFFLNGKGKILAHGFLVAFSDRIVFSGVGDQATVFCDHLNRYIIREDVELKDDSSLYTGLFVPYCEASLEKLRAGTELGLMPEVNGHNQALPEIGTHIGLQEIAGDGWLLTGDRSSADSLRSMIEGLGLKECSMPALEMLRVEKATPWFGIDIQPEHLPQELNRDVKAISFVKGCYLGQETVARIDAIGKVNKFLVSIDLGSDGPDNGTELFLEDADFKDNEKPIGVASTVAWSPTGQQFKALAMLRRKHAETKPSVRWIKN